MKLFVWDFHGVLEKGNDFAVLEITNAILEQFGYSRKMTMVEAEMLAGKRWHEYFSHLLPDSSHHEHLALQSACLEMSSNRPDIIAKYIQLNDHAEFVLQSIAENNFTQILISNTPPKTLDFFVKMVGIEKFFSPKTRFGAAALHHQTTKKECLKTFLDGKTFPDGIVSIGDSPADMALIQDHSKSVGYLYTYPGRSHREAHCHYKIQDLREVLREL